MFRRYRQRRGPYAMAAPSVVPSIIRSLILLGIVIFMLYIAGKWILWLFGGGNSIQRTAVNMTVEDRGTVSVSLEGGLLQRAEDSIKLYAGDRVTTGGNGNARLQFFDGSLARIDVQSDITIEESERGEEESTLGMSVAQGALWLRTPDANTFSGAITRVVDGPRYVAIIPSDADVVLEQDALIVFSADGQGVQLGIDGIAEPVYIGEGQQIVLPDGDVTGDPLRYRSAIDPLAIQRDFVEESRRLTVADSGTGASSVSTEDVMLTVSSPVDKMAVNTATVRVEGTVAKRVERVRVNGYDATINRADGSFTQELTLRQGEPTTVTVEALDARGVTLSKVVRTVTQAAQAIASPTITSPAQAGQTYRTSKTEFAIAGTVPAGTAGVMVNDYKLQLFRTGDTTWSYLASTALNNLKQGTNVYDVYALDAQGNKSQPVRITILLEAGPEGVIGSTPSSAAASSAAVQSESALPQNTPLKPGTIAVTGPAAGSSYTATGSEFLLEGTVPAGTASVWVNGYRLQLYKPGTTYWNYIASTQYATLKPGTNVYTINARNEAGQIIDTFTYTVTYR